MRSMAIKKALEVGQGETLVLTTRLTDDTGVVNLAGHLVTMTIRVARNEEVVGVYEGSTPDAEGWVTITVPAADTATMPQQKLAYVVEHIAPDATVRWMLYGTVTVKGVTQV